MAKRGRKKPAKGEGRRIRLRPADPFDLIQLLARTQNDPRKALAELVQNSIEAGARSVIITRYRRRGEQVVSVFDDGEGVFPGCERAQALERIATNVGRSFKKDLSPMERRELMMQGKYGIGILGFWSIGRQFEMRSRVRGSVVWVLRLREEDPKAEVAPLGARRLPFADETWTEILVSGVHPTAARQLSSRRLGDYLGSELRGQLLGRQVELRLIDRIARGRAMKDFTVQPKRFSGQRIPHPTELPVPGFPPARVELYLVPPGDERGGRIALSSAGTVVCDDIGGLEGLELDHAPWTGGRIEGLIDFADLDVTPGTRRGAVPNEKLHAFVEALRTIEPELLEAIREDDRRREEEEEEDIVRELRKIFRVLPERLPHYELFNIRGREEAPGPLPQGAELGQAAPPEDAEPTGVVVEEGDAPEPEPGLFPPGPLTSVRIVPKHSKILQEKDRPLLAKALDAEGRTIEEGTSYLWRITDGEGRLDAEDNRAVFTAPSTLGRTVVLVEAAQEERSAEASATIDTVERIEPDPGRDAGIPPPKAVSERFEDWRSRILTNVWEYNIAHPDFEAVRQDRRRRIRYLASLLAKELVLKNYGQPADARILEKMVEVLTHIEGKT